MSQLWSKDDSVDQRAKMYRRLVSDWRYWLAPKSAQFIQCVAASALLIFGIVLIVLWIEDGGRNFLQWKVIVSFACYMVFLTTHVRLRAVRDARMTTAIDRLVQSVHRCPGDARCAALTYVFKIEPTAFYAKALELETYLRLLNGTRNPFIIRFTRIGERIWRFFYDHDGKQRMIALCASLAAAILFLSRDSGVTLTDVFFVISESPAFLVPQYLKVVSMLWLLLFELAAAWDFVGFVLAEIDSRVDSSADVRLVIRDLLRMHQLPAMTHRIPPGESVATEIG